MSTDNSECHLQKGDRQQFEFTTVFGHLLSNCKMCYFEARHCSWPVNCHLTEFSLTRFLLLRLHMLNPTLKIGEKHPEGYKNRQYLK